MGQKKSYKILANHESMYAKNRLTDGFVFPAGVQLDTRPMWLADPEKGCNILSEYDVVVADIERANQHIYGRVSQLEDFLERTNGIFVFVMNQYQADNSGVSNFGLVSKIFYTKVYPKEDILLLGQHGEEIELTPDGKKSVFAQYLLSKKGRWVTVVHGVYSEDLVALAKNANGDIVAFSLRGCENRVFFLPWLESKELLWDAIFALLHSRDLATEAVPDWVSGYVPPKLQETVDKIAEVKAEILVLENKKKGLEDFRNELQFIRNTLLSRDGIVLQHTVRDVLMELGIDAKDGPEGREDITFVERAIHFVTEVKGAEGSAAQKHISQLIKNKGEYDSENPTAESKGVLLVNPFRKLPLEMRNDKDHQSFPPNVVDLAKKRGFTLLTTQQLFVAYCQMLEGRFNENEFVGNLLKTSGVYEGLDEIAKYKISS